MEIAKVNMQTTTIAGEIAKLDTVADHDKAWEKVELATKNAKALICHSAKQKLSHGEYTGFCKAKNISIDYFSNLVSYANTLLYVEDSNPGTCPDSVPDTVSQHKALKGKTPEEKLNNFAEVVESTGKEQPSIVDIKDFNKQERVKEAWEVEAEYKKLFDVDMPELALAYKEAIGYKTQAEFGLNFDESDILLALYPDWKQAYRVMSKAFHEDTGEIKCDTCMNIIARINEIMKHYGKVEKSVDMISNYERQLKAFIEKEEGSLL